MLFSSMTFIYAFLPVVCTIYFLIKKEFRNFVLLVASMVFYAWGEPRYFAILLLTILTGYFGALIIDKKRTKTVLFLIILLNLSFLIYFKYFNFLIENINLLFHSNIDFIKVIMPIGISFYMFHALSYVIDVYKKETTPQKDIYKLSLYICLFPKLIVGPIVKYHDIKEQIDNREETFDKVCLGIKRFIAGLSKKVIIANIMGEIVEKIFSQNPDSLTLPLSWLGAICYSFQIYFDFSGYSDMAIGLGLIFGFEFMENFNYPYISKSVTEFWRRWHISLSAWFKNYIYIPLGGSKQGLKRTCINLFIVFLLTGIWHGASWNFIVWGLWYALFLVFEKITLIHKTPDKKPFIKHVYTLLVVIIGWIIFRAENLTFALSYIKTMFNIFKLNPIETIRLIPFYINIYELIALLSAFIISSGIFKNIVFIQNKKVKLFVNVWFLILLFISTGLISLTTYNPFIYFRF